MLQDNEKEFVKDFIFAFKVVVTCFFIYEFVNLMFVNFIGSDDIRRHSAIQFIQMHGYPAESHYVTTTDGYIINVHRIPGGKTNRNNGKVVYLAHELWVSSMLWLFSGPESSLAFKLADEGYDVWMINFRGTEYSRNHTVLNPNTDSMFWNFTFHEMGIYDLSSSIDYVLEKTNNRDLFYVGISQGTTAMYALTSIMPKFNAKIKTYILMGPIAFMRHTKFHAMRILGQLMNLFKEHFIEGTKVFSQDSLSTQFLIKFCSSDFGKSFCENLNSLVCGNSRNETNTTLIPLGITHVLCGGSSKEFLHFAQGAISGHFRQYDYGDNGNLLKYGKNTPPDYDLSKVTTSGYLFYAGNDNLVDNNTDLPRLSSALGKCRETFFFPTLNHIDFLISKNAPKMIYSEVLKILGQYQIMH